VSCYCTPLSVKITPDFSATTDTPPCWNCLTLATQKLVGRQSSMMGCVLITYCRTSLVFKITAPQNFEWDAGVVPSLDYMNANRSFAKKFIVHDIPLVWRDRRILQLAASWKEQVCTDDFPPQTCAHSADLCRSALYSPCATGEQNPVQRMRLSHYYRTCPAEHSG
jgi:hypothetical protein